MPRIVDELPDGKYAVPCGDQARLFWIRSIGNSRVVYYKAGRRWQSFAFLLDDAGSLLFHKQQEATWTKQQLESARKAVAVLASDPAAANQLYINVT